MASIELDVAERIQGGLWYVQCASCNSFALVPGEDRAKVTFGHLARFPGHYNVLSSPSTKI